MKLKFRADAKDILYFVLFTIFLFYMIAVGVGNITSLSRTGRLVGFNPFPGLSPENIFGTLLFFFIALGAIIMLVSSYFFDREKGIGISKEKKTSGGYAKWAKVDDIKKINNKLNNNLSIGEILVIPSNTTSENINTTTYTVKYGDTLYSIAKKYNTSVSDIKNLNNLSTNILSIGQKLILPI